MSSPNESPNPKASNTAVVKAPKRNALFYWSGGFVIFLVDDEEFRVPVHRFFDSPKFAAEHQLSPSASVEMTVKLTDTTAPDFRIFLQVFYPPHQTFNRPKARSNIQDWLVVLDISTKWHFFSLRKEAIQFLHALGLDKKVVLGRKYSITSWIVSAYTEMVTSPDLLPAKEAAAIGWPTFHRICQIREALPKKKATQSVGLTPALRVHDEFESEIEAVFAKERAFLTPDECAAKEATLKATKDSIALHKASLKEKSSPSGAASALKPPSPTASTTSTTEGAPKHALPAPAADQTSLIAPASTSSATASPSAASPFVFPPNKSPFSTGFAAHATAPPGSSVPTPAFGPPPSIPFSFGVPKLAPAAPTTLGSTVFGQASSESASAGPP